MAVRSNKRVADPATGQVCGAVQSSLNVSLIAGRSLTEHCLTSVVGVEKRQLRS